MVSNPPGLLRLQAGLDKQYSRYYQCRTKTRIKTGGELSRYNRHEFKRHTQTRHADDQYPSAERKGVEDGCFLRLCGYEGAIPLDDAQEHGYEAR